MTPQSDPLIDSVELIQHSHEMMSRLRGEPPTRFRFDDEDVGWLITRYDDVKLVSTDPRLSRDWDGLNRIVHDADDDPYDGYGWIYRSILYLDPPDHTRLRRLVSKAFTPRAIERLRPRIEQVADDLLDQMDGDEVVDLLPSFAVALPVIAISELLGVPDEDRPDFWAWSHILNGHGTDADRPAVKRAAAEYLGALAERKRAEPGPDLLSHMAMASEDGDQMSRRELIAMALLMLMAGHDTTANLIANGTLAFLRSPDQLALLRADPSLLPNAVEEVLRYDCPVNVSTARFTLEPIEIGGVLIPAGEMLYPSMLGANRDPREFTDPDTFDIRRHNTGHLGLGHGIHFCLGAPLARMEGRIALGRLFARFPGLSLAAGPDRLVYRHSTLMHGPVSLPVRLG